MPCRWSASASTTAPFFTAAFATPAARDPATAVAMSKLACRMCSTGMVTLIGGDDGVY